MKTIQKLFMITVLGMGVYVHETQASEVQAQIRAKVHSHHHEIANIKNSVQLNKLLAELKSEILQVLNRDGIQLSQKEMLLKSALESLNPSDKISIASNIRQILDNLEHDISGMIKSAIPQLYRSILGIN